MSFAISFAVLAFAASALTTFLSLLKLRAAARATLRRLAEPAEKGATGSVVVAKEVGYRTGEGRLFSVVNVRSTAPVEIWTQPSDWERGHIEIDEAGVHRTRRQRKLHLRAKDFIFRSSTLWATYDPRPSLRRVSIGCSVSAVVSLLGVAVVLFLAYRDQPVVGAIWALTQFLVMPVVENTLTERSRTPTEGGRTFLETT